MDDERDEGVGADLRSALAEVTAEQSGSSASAVESEPAASSAIPKAQRERSEPAEKSSTEPAGEPFDSPVREFSESRDDHQAAAGAAGRRHDALPPEDWSRRLERGARLEDDFGAVDQLFAPHRELLRSQGRGPKDIIKIWHDVETGLTRRDAGAHQIAARIITNYGLDPGVVWQMISHLQGNVPTSAASPSHADPATEQRLRTLEAANAAERNAASVRTHQASIDALQRQIDDFARCKDKAGNLRHPHFKALEPDMIQLAAFDRLRGKPIDFEDLYTRAAWTNPAIRDQLITGRRAPSPVPPRRQRSLNSTGSLRDDILTARG